MVGYQLDDFWSLRGMVLDSIWVFPKIWEPPPEEWHWRSTTRRDNQYVFLLTQSLVN